MEINDIFGVEPIAEAAKKVIEDSFEGLGAFLKKVFEPGFEELGYLIKDQVRQWRLTNVLKVMYKAKGKLSFEDDNLQILANPRVGLSIIEECSMVDDEELQDMWAGLFVSSCTIDGKDDSNLIFVDLLKRISSVEAKILKFGCEHCKKVIYPSELIVSDGELEISLEELIKLTGISDVNRLDRELDHMSSLSLFTTELFGSSGGFVPLDKGLKAVITPSALALNLYYKTNSVNCSSKEFWRGQVTEYHK